LKVNKIAKPKQICLNSQVMQSLKLKLKMSKKQF
jgi:hypothetical protein